MFFGILIVLPCFLDGFRVRRAPLVPTVASLSLSLSPSLSRSFSQSLSLSRNFSLSFSLSRSLALSLSFRPSLSLSLNWGPFSRKAGKGRKIEIGRDPASRRGRERGRIICTNIDSPSAFWLRPLKMP